MATRPIVTWPDAILKRKCVPVVDFDPALVTLLEDMRETMADAEGLGLAANQVGEPLRLFLMGQPLDPERSELEVVEVINPTIEARRGEIKYEEGCLSFPEIYQQVLRAEEVDVRFVDRHGVEQRRTFRDLPSVCFQHELDHLDGITFLDRLSPLKRRLALRAYNRSLRQRTEDERDELQALVRGPR